MTYTVTTKRQTGGFHMNGTRHHVIVSRRAVATLDEAKREVIVQAGYAPERSIPLALHQSLELLPESGGRVGPRPDGTIIEVDMDQHHPVPQYMEGDPLENAERLLAAVLEGREPHDPIRRGHLADLEVALAEVRRAMTPASSDMLRAEAEGPEFSK